MQASDDFISNNINKINSNIYENISMNLAEKQGTPESAISVSETYEPSRQSIINLESNSINLNQNFSKKSTIENFNKNEENLSKNIFEEDYVSSKTVFIEELSNSKNNHTEKDMPVNKKENNIILDLHTKFDHASTLFQTTDSDESSFFKDISDTIIPDKNSKSHRNIIENDIISNQTNYNDIWKTIGEDTDFLPDEIPHIKNHTNSYINNIKNGSGLKTAISNKEINSLLKNNTEDCFNQISNASSFYLDNPKSNETSFEKPNNTCSYNIGLQTNILDINKLKDAPSQFLSSQIPTESYFSTANLEQNETALKSYISAKGGYLSPYDLPMQIIHKFKHPINPISNKYSEIQKHNYSLNHPETNINEPNARLYNLMQNISINKNISDNPIMFHNDTASKSTINQKKFQEHTPINTPILNINMPSIQQTFKTYEEKTEEKNKMFQDFPLELSGNSKIQAQNIHKTLHIAHIQNSNTRTEYPNTHFFTINQQNLKEIDQTYSENNQNIPNIPESNFLLSNMPPSINNPETNIQEINLNYFSLNSKKTQDIYEKSRIQKNTLKSNDIIDPETKVINRTNLYSQYSSVPYNSKRNISNNEDIWDPNNKKSLEHQQSYPFTSKYEPYSPSIKQNLSPTLDFSSDTNNSYSQSEKQYDTLMISNEYSSFGLPSHLASDIYINNSLSNGNENSKIYNFQEKSETAYHKNDFKNTNHPILVWGFGGKIITIFPNKINVSNNTEYMHFNSSNTFGTLKISNIRSYVEKSELLQLMPPGPLFSTSKSTNKTYKKEAIKWMKEKIQLLEHIENYEQNNSNSPNQMETIHLILNLLYPELQLLNKKEHEFTITADFANHSSNINENVREISSYIVTQESLEQIKLYLLKGAKDNALQFCLDKKLWSHALLISSSMNREAWKYVVKNLKFFYETLYESDSETENSIFFDKIINTQINKIDKSCQDHLNDWKEKLAIILSNPNDKDFTIIYNLVFY
ncbi:unnamed protein product [Pneumocystis jirovecii]|uniref:Protein transport protein sec16 n=1 Tax=Pneumocystis jirovecii TaxID=42068 RepID=L0PAE1_PNEJI|nr:unnamed protein product [Pneumocystis jirovecii]